MATISRQTLFTALLLVFGCVLNHVEGLDLGERAVPAHSVPDHAAADDSNGDLTLRLLPDAPAATGARCLDGSAPGYWIRRSSATTGYVLHHEGGGWCWTAEECAGRAKTALGSSAAWPQVGSCYGRCDGILSGNATENPDVSSMLRTIPQNM